MWPFTRPRYSILWAQLGSYLEMHGPVMEDMTGPEAFALVREQMKWFDGTHERDDERWPDV